MINSINNNGYDENDNNWNASYPIGGNYWDDYVGEDLFQGPDQDIPGSDGIGDTPYTIAGGSNQDYYPLIDPWSPPSSYAITNLGVFGDDTNASYAYGINDQGQIVGSSGEEYGIQTGFLWQRVH